MALHWVHLQTHTTSFCSRTRATHSCDRAGITFKHVEHASGRDTRDFSSMRSHQWPHLLWSSLALGPVLASVGVLSQRTGKGRTPPLLPIASIHWSLGTHDFPLLRARHPTVSRTHESDKSSSSSEYMPSWKIVISPLVCFSYCLPQWSNFFLFIKLNPTSVTSSFNFGSNRSSPIPIMAWTWRHITPLNTRECNVNKPRHIRCLLNPFRTSTSEIFSQHLRGASFNSKTSFKMSNKLPSWTLGRAGPFFGGQQYKTRSLSWNSPCRIAACTSAVSRTHFSRPLLALTTNRTLMASRQAVGESLRMSNTSGSAYPGTTIRADAFVSKGFSGCAFAFVFLSTNTNRDCITRSCENCFVSLRQMTLASAGGVTVAVSGNSLKEEQLLTSIQAMPLLLFGWSSFPEKRIVQQLRHDDDALFNVDSIPSSFSGEGRGCFEVRRRRNGSRTISRDSSVTGSGSYTCVSSSLWSSFSATGGSETGRSQSSFTGKLIFSSKFGARLELWFDSSFVCLTWRDFTRLDSVAMKHFFYQNPSKECLLLSCVAS